MGIYKSLFKQTAIYGLATVLPRVFSFLLTPLYTDARIMDINAYGEVSVIFSWMVLFNVVLAYGMETAFFRFYNSEDKNTVLGTSTLSLFWSSIIFLVGALLFRETLSSLTGIEVEYITYTIWILVLDALVIIPFSKLRATQRPGFYTFLKVGNVALNLALNIFFLIYLPQWAKAHPGGFWEGLYQPNFQIGYIFIANLIASLLTLLLLLPHYIKLHWQFDRVLWRNMMRYALPILIAGIAFAINEAFDRILLDYLLPPLKAKADIGAYAACYKLALFMTLFATAFRLGVEPFFFSHAKHENARETYAMITKYFIIFGSVILLGIVVYADVLKIIIIRDSSYWRAMEVVPLIILANFFLGIYHNLSVWYKLTDRTRMGAYISIVGAVVTLFLNFILIPKFSYIGSAIATIAAYGSMMFLSFWLGAKYYPIPYDLKKIGRYLGLSIGLTTLSFYFFRENYWIGTLFFLSFLYFVYRNEKQVILTLMQKTNRHEN
ncbi:MAG: lipopolysaccharide biosynthesis protein [Flavobacterium sp.]